MWRMYVLRAKVYQHGLRSWSVHSLYIKNCSFHDYVRSPFIFCPSISADTSVSYSDLREYLQYISFKFGCKRVFPLLYVAYLYIAGYAGQANTCFSELIHYFLCCKAKWRNWALCFGELFDDRRQLYMDHGEEPRWKRCRRLTCCLDVEWKLDTLTKWGFVGKRSGYVWRGNLRIQGTATGILVMKLWEINVSSPTESCSLN
jgi:hypothetical protein